MVRHTRLQALNAVHEIGVVPVFYNGDIATVQNIAKACVNGGIRVLEFTNRGDHAWEVFSALDRFCAVLERGRGFSRDLGPAHVSSDREAARVSSVL